MVTESRWQNRDRTPGIYRTPPTPFSVQGKIHTELVETAHTGLGIVHVPIRQIEEHNNNLRTLVTYYSRS